MATLALQACRRTPENDTCSESVKFNDGAAWIREPLALIAHSHRPGDVQCNSPPAGRSSDVENKGLP